MRGARDCFTLIISNLRHNAGLAYDDNLAFALVIGLRVGDKPVASVRNAFLLSFKESLQASRCETSILFTRQSARQWERAIRSVKSVITQSRIDA